MAFIKYLILCLRLAIHEDAGNISKHEADMICINYLKEL